MGGFIKGVVSGIGKVLQNPIVQMGLGFLTGGTSLLAGGISSIAGNLGNLGSVFSGLTSMFGGSAQSMGSGSWLGTVGNFLGGAVNSGQGTNGITNMFSSLINGWNKTGGTDSQSRQIAEENSQQMAAYYQAQAMRQQMMNGVRV